MEGLSLFIGIFRKLRAKILRREVEIIGQCRLCGNCCKGVLLKDRDRWLRNKRQFKRLCADSPGHERFEIIGKDDYGHLCFACTKQGDDNLCTCYEERLELCKDYPSTSLYYQGGWLGHDCGFSFKAVTFRDIFMRRKPVNPSAFADILQKEQENNRSSS